MKEREGAPCQRRTRTATLPMKYLAPIIKMLFFSGGSLNDNKL